MKRNRSLAILFAVLLVLAAGCDAGSKVRNPLNWDTEDFQYTNQDGKPYGSKELKGKVWVADFIFTSCTTVCPPMTANLARLQKMAKEKNLDVHFVSFSVDPQVDNPQALQMFADKFSADRKNWNFLTGYSQEEIERFAKKNFRTFVDKPDTSNQVVHGTSFFLVDKDGKVVKKYSGVSNTPYEDIIRDIERLTK
ncbi:SCO family protein [Ectobacillus panaciterrae]|uniref:SCO family protein n=1 Tax=Ectobacillus panaciterrae TaxID=363872 RepID=UPI00041FF50C|nr:SCO family protein [Ectobacillus panaciterrae]